MEARDDEGRQIARKIHDTTLQDLVAALFQVDQLRAGLGDFGDDGERLQAALIDLRALITRALDDLRALSHLLHRPELDMLGLGPTMRSHVREVARRSGIRVSVEMPDDMPRLPGPVERALFRVVEEALTNVQRHSGSREARIVLERRAPSITLEVVDRGGGIRNAPPAPSAGTRPGVGLAELRVRLEEVGGALEILSGADGTTLRASVPDAPSDRR
jgi:signal transduction histidine kinase